MLSNLKPFVWTELYKDSWVSDIRAGVTFKVEATLYGFQASFLIGNACVDHLPNRTLDDPIELDEAQQWCRDKLLVFINALLG